MEGFTVKFKPHDKNVSIGKGTDLLSAAFKAGIMLNSSCGGEGVCGKCKVIVRKGKFRTEESDRVSPSERKKGCVLACLTIPESDLEVSIPAEALEMPARSAKREKEIEVFSKGVSAATEKIFAHNPVVKKVYLELPRPTLDDNIGDLDRIYRELEDKFEHVFITTKLGNVKHLGEVIRDGDFKVTVTLAAKEGILEVLAIEPGDTTAANFGFVFDIGTTTVTGQLIDLNTKEILGTRIAYNKQASFGSDVITRIIYASEAEGLMKLNKAVLENLNGMIEELVKANEVNLSDVFSAVCAGNMTMMHLLMKIDPTYIRRKPYVPTTTVWPATNASELGLKINPRGVVWCLPGVSTYIGGDVIAGVLSSGLFMEEELALLVDIGTNGEIVLGNKDWMISCSASAGPAFEGSGISFGMKAVRGAIQKVGISGDLEVSLETIDGEKPKGICGSGYLTLLGEMLKRKITTKDGKMNGSVKSKRMRKNKTGHEFVVAFKKDTQIASDIVIKEEDIENLKRAKGAIYSAIATLLKKVEKSISDVRRIYIAGGFGSYLDIESAIYIGLLPDIDRKVYEFVGNSSISGARLSLLSRDALSKADELYKKITYLDLSSEPGYMDEYVGALFFPHTDSGRFPSVR